MIRKQRASEAVRACQDTPQPQSQSDDARMARLASDPCARAAFVATAFSPGLGKVSVAEILTTLRGKAARVHGDDLREVESTLVAQASALNAVFADLAVRAQRQEYIPQFESMLKLALRAQNQCRMTLETLANIKHPTVVFARQANIAGGHQQVNNGDAAPVVRAGETENRPNKLSRLAHEQRQSLDCRAPATSGAGNPPLEAVAAINRPDDTWRQGACRPECLPGRQAQCYARAFARAARTEDVG